MREITENVVMDHYLSLLELNKITFLAEKGETKKQIISGINLLKETDNIHDKIVLAHNLWKLLFEAAMVYIDKDKLGYDQLFVYFDTFVKFEELVFAADSFYRDHTLHTLWVYFLGEYFFHHPDFQVLLQDYNQQFRVARRFVELLENVGAKDLFREYLHSIKQMSSFVDYEDSIRCIGALAHDLGYPLKKISKINETIEEILPHFSISKFGEFQFQFENIQQSFIDNFLEILSYDFFIRYEKDKPLSYKEHTLIQEITSQIDQIAEGLMVQPEIDRSLIKSLKRNLANLNDQGRYILKNIYGRKAVLQKNVSRLLRFANDFERYEHGIMSSFLLTKIVNAFSNIQISYSTLSTLPENVNLIQMYSKLVILNAIANHTSPNYKITSLNHFSPFLLFMDEIEEFSRISRANQYREYINEFCRTEIFFDEGFLNINFIFDNDQVDELNPEIAFKDKCLRWLRLFDIPNLDNNLKIKFRCIGKLETNKNTYLLLVQKNQSKIFVNGKEQNKFNYLNTKEIHD